MKFDLKALRTMLGDGDKPISQAELARRLRVTQATVSRWEQKGEVSRLGAKLLSELEASRPSDFPGVTDIEFVGSAPNEH